jgi:hypothetical protein
MPCCGVSHPFDASLARRALWPDRVRCLVIGENPGVPGAAYFYDPVPSNRTDPIEIRRYMLAALAGEGLIEEPSLEAFSKAGFALDHVVRCQLPSRMIAAERRLAARYGSKRAAAADHLPPLIRHAEKVWAVGYLARNAVVSIHPEVRAQIKVTPPYSVGDRLFVSRYLNRFAAQQTRSIARDLGQFLAGR